MHFKLFTGLHDHKLRIDLEGHGHGGAKKFIYPFSLFKMLN